MSPAYKLELLGRASRLCLVLTLAIVAPRVAIWSIEEGWAV